jgi:hypothetical protein
MTPPSRYDDPLGIYQTAYAATTRYGAYMEKLAPLRPGIDLTNSVLENDPELPSSAPAGVLDSWLEKQCLGTGRLRGNFVDLGASASIAYLRQHLAPYLRKRRIREFDLSSLTSADRKLTMEISRFIFEMEPRIGQRLDGISYPSRLGNNITCWVVFSRPPASLGSGSLEPDHELDCVRNPQTKPINPKDPELKRALHDLNLTFHPEIGARKPAN